MTWDLADRGLRADVARIVETVYATMLGSPALPAEGAWRGSEPTITAAVHYEGAWNGAVVVECTGAQAAHWAERLMPITVPATAEDARDGLGELANVIAGNLKPLLPPGVRLSMPSVIEGAGHQGRFEAAGRCETFMFADVTGLFRISLVGF